MVLKSRSSDSGGSSLLMKEGEALTFVSLDARDGKEASGPPLRALQQ